MTTTELPVMAGEAIMEEEVAGGEELREGEVLRGEQREEELGEQLEEQLGERREEQLVEDEEEGTDQLGGESRNRIKTTTTIKVRPLAFPHSHES